MDNTEIEAYWKLANQSHPDRHSKSFRHAKGLDRWKSLLAEFSEANIRDKAVKVYAQKTFFNDTLKTLRSPERIEAYLLDTAEMLQYGRVEFRDAVEFGNDVYIRWRMIYRNKKLSKNQDIITIGMSHLRFDEQENVVLHQDFWDSTRGIFQHVPVIGFGIRALTKRM